MFAAAAGLVLNTATGHTAASVGRLLSLFVYRFITSGHPGELTVGNRVLLDENDKIAALFEGR